MAYPTQRKVERALIAELRARGEPTRATRLYASIADRLGISIEDRKRRRRDGQSGTEWVSRVQWARRRLADAGVLVYQPRRPWALAVWEKNDA